MSTNLAINKKEKLKAGKLKYFNARVLNGNHPSSILKHFNSELSRLMCVFQGESYMNS